MVAVVESLAKGRDRDQRQVAGVVGGVELPLAEDVAERVDAVGEVVQDEDPDEAAPEQAGEGGEEGAPISQPRKKGSSRPPIAQ